MAQKEIIKPLKPEVKLLYNGKDCTNDFSKYLRSFVFKEFEDEQSDELNIILNNNDGYFSDLWYPQKGDKITANIIYGVDNFSCGIFTIDDNNFNFEIDGDDVEIRALATSINAPLRTQKIKNHSGKTLLEIARSIGKTYGFKVLDNGANINVGTIIQKNESDISFLKRIAREYGYIFNIKDGYLTFIELEELHNQDAIFSLYKEDFEYFNVSDSTTKMYGSVKVSYFDSKTKTLKTYTSKSNTQLSDTLTIHRKCSSIEEAKKLADSALKNGSKEIKGRIKPKEPLLNFIAGVNFDIYGVGKFEGKYHIKSAERKIDENGYNITGEVEKCI